MKSVNSKMANLYFIKNKKSIKTTKNENIDIIL